MKAVLEKNLTFENFWKPELVRWLVAIGAVLTDKDQDGKTAQQLASDRRTLVAFPGHIDPVDVSAQKTAQVLKSPILQ